MLGRFLEISVQTPDIQASLAFYEELGFTQLPVGETWSHPYAVVTDGHLYIGLHDYQFDSPALTYARPGLAGRVRSLEDTGIRFAFRKLSDDQFNEAGFRDPDGQMVALLEARTYSPYTGGEEDFSILGRCSEYCIPVSDVGASVAFWEPLGFVMTDREEDPVPRALLISDCINIGLCGGNRLLRPGLVFTEPDMDKRIEFLIAKNMHIARPSPLPNAGDTSAVLASPEGLDMHLLVGE
ncbi:MAG: VOC family protein [Gammaproteobacteria bacterium]